MENASSLISKFLIPDDKTLLIILVRKITVSTQAKTGWLYFSYELPVVSYQRCGNWVN